jgi:hypothetical protein
MSMEEKQSQKVILHATRGVHGNRHEYDRIRSDRTDPRTGDGNGVFSSGPYFSKDRQTEEDHFFFLD